mmetsp:Transcript_39476/g.96665  ORF Transcript_39476/g.96665 Transcript_39476/m.96665 type:complete len:156 (-) Transcript_39476:45-512(-)
MKDLYPKANTCRLAAKKPASLDLLGVSNFSKQAEVEHAAGSAVTGEHEATMDDVTACPTCGRTFAEARHLVQHQNVVHRRLRPIACAVCPKVFGSRSNLTRHTRMVHEKVRDRQCLICSAKFCKATDLRRHVHMVHDSAIPGNHPSFRRRRAILR